MGLICRHGSCSVSPVIDLQPSDQRFNEEDEQQGRQCVSLNSNSLQGDGRSVAMLAADGCTAVLVEVSDDIHRVLRVAKSLQDLKEACMVNQSKLTSGQAERDTDPPNAALHLLEQASCIAIGAGNHGSF